MSNPKPIWELVIADMAERDKVGRNRYGEALTVETNMDAIQYAYEEALDLAVYLRCEIERRKNAAK